MGGSAFISNQDLSAGPVTFAAGATNTVHITSPTTSASCGTINNTATASARNAPSAQDLATITVECPNLSITKTADAATVSLGDQAGFTITVNNSGPGTTKGVTVSDPLPDLGGGQTWSIQSQSGGFTLSGTAGNQVLSAGPQNLPSGASMSVHVVGTTANCGTLQNTATASATNAPSVSASANITVQCPNLSITKTADAASVSVGDQAGFTLTITNNGPGTAENVTVSDPLPDLGGGQTWSIQSQSGGTFTLSGTAGSQVLSAGPQDLASGANASVHIIGTTASCGSLPNTATASATNAPSVSASASITVECPNLSITKTADAATVSVGDQAGFTITVHNNGPGTAEGVTVSDPLPDLGGGQLWTISPPVSGFSITGPAGSQFLLGSLGDLASGASVSVHVVGTTASCGILPNTATASATNALSVSASASITVECPNLSITKTADAATVSVGDKAGFTLTITNNGPGTAEGVTLSDPLPNLGGSQLWTISPPVSGFSISGSAGSQVLLGNLGDLAPGASMSVHVVGTTSSVVGTLNNTATAKATNAPSVSASASITVVSPQLAITKTADASSVSVGDQAGFTITVQNNGPGTAEGVTLSDPLPNLGGGQLWTIPACFAWFFDFRFGRSSDFKGHFCISCF